MPERIQLSRKKGWKMPPNTVNVARPSKWGNPYKVSVHLSAEQAVEKYRQYLRSLMWKGKRERTVYVSELRGKNLACWCPLDQPCHADVLLELAKQEKGP